jgi:hypothetical protein
MEVWQGFILLSPVYIIMLIYLQDRKKGND